ncbi:hypothetical protein RBH89_20645 [Paracidovorax avenae]
MDDPNKQSDDFHFDLRLRFRGRRRRFFPPLLVVCLAMIGAASFWKVIYRLVAGAG